MIDTFKPIPNYPGYAINDKGEVINFLSRHGHGKTFATFLKPTLDKTTGYHCVGVVNAKGVRHMARIHVLVAMTFLGQRPEGMDIDHKDGNKLNNSVENLHYVTRKQNQMNPNNRGKNGYQKYGSRKVVAIKDGIERVFRNCATMCKELGLRPSTVSYCLSGKRDHFRGYAFRWA